MRPSVVDELMVIHAELGAVSPHWGLAKLEIILQTIFSIHFYAHTFIWIQLTSRFITYGPINNKQVLIKMMAWHRIGAEWSNIRDSRNVDWYEIPRGMQATLFQVKNIQNRRNNYIKQLLIAKQSVRKHTKARKRDISPR